MKTLRTFLFTLPFVLSLTACSNDEAPPDASAEVDMAMADPADMAPAADMVPAADMTTAPADMATPDTDMTTPPVDMVAPVDLAMLRR